MRIWARSINEVILDEIKNSNEPGLAPLQQVLLGVRVDADGDTPGFFARFLGFGSRVLSSIKRRIWGEAKSPPVEAVGEDIARHVKLQMRRVLGIRPEEIATAHNIEVWRNENVNLITKLTAEQLTKVENLLNSAGTIRVEDLARQLQATLGETERRATLIAQDQTLKFNAQLTKEIHRQAGIEEYYWVSVGDESVRDIHEELNDRSAAGERFRYDDPPVSEKNGAAFNPGEGYRCRCQAIPYVPEYED
jgi:SPP1 gp7 family putative phage head morphogenesis protein